MMSRRVFISLLSLCAAALVSSATAFAETYPSRPVRWIVPYPAGGATDILARLVGHRLSERFGQQFIIENKAGAGNNIGTEAVVNSAPDGYTLLLVNPANAINASLYAKLNYNFVRDIVPVAGITRTPNIMTVSKAGTPKTARRLTDIPRAN